MLEGNNANAPGALSAFLLGALVGGGIALLYSPRSGPETRGMLADRAHDMKHKAESALDQARSTIHDKKDQVLAAVDAGIQAIQSQREKIAGQSCCSDSDSRASKG